MNRLVAFLRGINVGGRVVKKEQLIEVFRSLGFSNVVTYKQSGNVIFETNADDLREITGNIERKLRQVLGYDVAVLVRSVTQLKAILQKNPFKDQKEESTSYLVTLLPAPISNLPFHLPLIIPKSTAKISFATSTEIFSETHGGGEGALPNPFVESKLKIKATTRNLNIIAEIVAKYRLLG